jgi:hypothetical protein
MKKVSSKEMREVKGGFNPKFSVSDDDIGIQRHIYEVCGPEPRVYIGCKPLPPYTTSCADPFPDTDPVY